MAPYTGFCGGGYTSQSVLAAQERTVNLIPERIEATGAWALYPIPGVTTFATVSGKGGCRALFEENGRCFAVVQDSFVELSSDGTVTTRGTVASPSLTPARITSNGDGGNQLFITAGGKGYAYDLTTNTLTEILSANMGHCDMLDGFLMALDRTDSTLMVSTLFNATSWPAVNHEQRAALPDPWLALRVLNQQIYLIGERSTDLYYNAGLSPFPFAQAAAGAIPWGIAAVDSLTKAGGSLLWLARSESSLGAVVQVSGSSAREVSTHALRAAIRRYRETVGISDAVGMSYEEDGHVFYVLTFPAADATWVYDLTTQLWTERLTWLHAEGRYTAWRPYPHVIAFGQHLCGDRVTGTIYRLDAGSMLDTTGAYIRRLRRAPALFQDGQRFTVSRLEVHLEPGLGVSSGQGSDPHVMLSISRDAKTWHACAPVSAGAQGEYGTKVEWTRLGTGRYFIPEITMTDPIPWRIHGASVAIR